MYDSHWWKRVRGIPLKRVFQFLAFVFVGGIIGWLLPINSPFTQGQIVQNRGVILRQSTGTYKYITPLLACDIGTENSFPELGPIKASLEDVINKEIDQGNAKSVSVYVRTLQGSRWFEINGGEQYAPASLLKVFVMMAYYKADDDVGNGSELTRQLAFHGSSNPGADTPGEIIPHLINGQSYTVDALIKQMIVYSDNDAFNTLVDGFDKSTYAAFQTIFSDLQIPSPVTQTEDSMNFMSVDQYTMVFRVLYSATYLSRTYSEKALGLLGQVQYKDGIVAGVPDGMMVSHKFGVRQIPAAQNSGAVGAELHDCGIVYYPNHPYLLCIMTRGTDFGKLQNVIQNISQDAYKQLDIFFTTAKISNSDPSNFGTVAFPR